MRRSPQGFSLIELLVVVAIILIIAAIAIPNLLQSRMAANQASAVGSMRAIITAEFNYSATYNTGYSANLSQLGPPASGGANSAQADLVDNVLAGGSKSGYRFSYTSSVSSSGKIDSYSLVVDPTIPGITGTNHYYTDQSGVIRQNSTAVAASSDSPIGG